MPDLVLPDIDQLRRWTELIKSPHRASGQSHLIIIGPNSHTKVQLGQVGVQTNIAPNMKLGQAIIRPNFVYLPLFVSNTPFFQYLTLVTNMCLHWALVTYIYSQLALFTLIW